MAVLCRTRRFFRRKYLRSAYEPRGSSARRRFEHNNAFEIRNGKLSISTWDSHIWLGGELIKIPLQDFVLKIQGVGGAYVRGGVFVGHYTVSLHIVH